MPAASPDFAFTDSRQGQKLNYWISYLENAALPAWNRLGIKPVGAFTERDSKEAPAVYVLISVFLSRILC